MSPELPTPPQLSLLTLRHRFLSAKAMSLWAVSKLLSLCSWFLAAGTATVRVGTQGQLITLLSGLFHTKVPVVAVMSVVGTMTQKPGGVSVCYDECHVFLTVMKHWEEGVEKREDWVWLWVSEALADGQVAPRSVLKQSTMLAKGGGARTKVYHSRTTHNDLLLPLGPTQQIYWWSYNFYKPVTSI